MTTHYIGMAGLHGCLPQTCATYDTLANAAEGLGFIHELGKGRILQLKREMYLELKLKRDGNECAEIVECDCDTPDIHNDA